MAFGQGIQGTDAAFPGFAQADEDAGGEGDPGMAGGFQGFEAALASFFGGDVGQVVDIFQHDTHGDVEGTETFELIPVECTVIAVGQESGVQGCLGHMDGKAEKVIMATFSEFFTDVGQLFRVFARDEQCFPGTLGAGLGEKVVEGFLGQQSFALRAKAAVGAVPWTVMGQGQGDGAGVAEGPDHEVEGC